MRSIETMLGQDSKTVDRRSLPWTGKKDNAVRERRVRSLLWNKATLIEIET